VSILLELYHLPTIAYFFTHNWKIIIRYLPPLLDSVLISYKSFSSKQFELLQKSLTDYMGSKKESIKGSNLGSNIGPVEEINGRCDAGSESAVGPSVCPLS
jgi:hypothetical protein